MSAKGTVTRRSVAAAGAVDDAAPSPSRSKPRSGSWNATPAPEMIGAPRVGIPSVAAVAPVAAAARAAVRKDRGEHRGTPRRCGSGEQADRASHQIEIEGRVGEAEQHDGVAVGPVEQEHGARLGFERLGHGRAAQVERVGERVEVGDGQHVALPRQVVEEDRVGPAAGGDEVASPARMERLARIGAGQDVAARAAEDRRQRLARAEAEHHIALAGAVVGAPGPR